MDRKAAPNRIHELRGLRKLNQKELAESVRAHWVTISKLERGQMKLTQDWMNRLAAALHVEPHELLADAPLERTVYVDGSVRRDGAVELDVSRDAEACPFIIDLGTPQPLISFWYFAEEPIYPPVIQPGHLLRFTHHQDKQEIEQYIGSICILHFEDERNSKLGVLYRGAGEDLFDLATPDGKMLLSLKPSIVAKLTMIMAAPRFSTAEDGYPLP